MDPVPASVKVPVMLVVPVTLRVKFVPVAKVLPVATERLPPTVTLAVVVAEVAVIVRLP